MIKCHLSKLMGKHKHSLTDVHRLTGLSRATLHRLYHETNDAIRYETIKKLCSLYRCQVGDLIEWIPDNKVNDENGQTDSVPGMP
ncbi:MULTISPECIES: helix-turn-helix transcriptional regulator [Kyrpidia]|uniref:Transcriptional regulator, XRE family n=1 Tax=Kyrpidia spormannii TaxID=2055160 RepID=A0ACA8Z6T7_9BACL|nr:MULTISPECIES: helix-turn-helix transcriptional regulator [Kyrpidia]MCL6576950.1 helix-turn-helix transcriptional regulator [Kyrpidia sp.]CAB3390017.1 putative transcriptional regulator, XRE family [Kyrpidia spormannii]